MPLPPHLLGLLQPLGEATQPVQQTGQAGGMPTGCCACCGSSMGSGCGAGAPTCGCGAAGSEEAEALEEDLLLLVRGSDITASVLPFRRILPAWRVRPMCLEE